MSDATADAYCWPHSSAMNTAEINRMVLRIGMFQRRGLQLLQAESLADRCMLRDRDIDARRACIECKNFQSGGTCVAKQVAMPKPCFTIATSSAGKCHVSKEKHERAID